MNRQTYRYVTKFVDFGSPKWQCIEKDLKEAGIYWFLTDPYRCESIAVMVSRYHEQQFLHVVNKIHDGEFYSREI